MPNNTSLGIREVVAKADLGTDKVAGAVARGATAGWTKLLSAGSELWMKGIWSDFGRSAASTILIYILARICTMFLL